MSTPLTDKINALTAQANAKTGASDATLTDAVKRLIAGEEVDPVYVVTVTMTSQTQGTTDKTYSEVYQAWTEGKTIRLNVPAMNAEINIIARSFIGEYNEMFTTYIKNNEDIIGGAIVKNGEDKMTAVLF